MEEENSVYRAFKLAVGGLLSIIVAGYVIGVFVSSGFDNPEHPQNEREWKRVLLKFVQKSQTPEELLQEIKEESARAERWGDDEAEEFRGLVSQRIARHRMIADRKAKVPEEHRISFGNQLKADLEEGLVRLFPDLVDIELKCVLMQEPYAYEVLGGSKVAYGDLLEYLVKVAVSQGWLMMYARASDKESLAYLTLAKEEQEIFVVLLRQEDVFEGIQTVVYCVFATEQYEGDEIPTYIMTGFLEESDESDEEDYDEDF